MNGNSTVLRRNEVTFVGVVWRWIQLQFGFTEKSGINSYLAERETNSVVFELRRYERFRRSKRLTLNIVIL